MQDAEEEGREDDLDSEDALEPEDDHSGGGQQGKSVERDPTDEPGAWS